MKHELISPRVLVNYNPKEKIVLDCDASNYGLSAILSHKYNNGEERPIAYASKKIAKSELIRKILDKEVMAIIFGFKKFYQFIFGKIIILRTDNKALQWILVLERAFHKQLTIDCKDGHTFYQGSGMKFSTSNLKPMLIVMRFRSFPSTMIQNQLIPNFLTLIFSMKELSLIITKRLPKKAKKMQSLQK